MEKTKLEILNEKKEKLKKIEATKTTAAGKLSVYRESYKKEKEKLKTFGIKNPDDEAEIQAFIDKTNADINAGFTELETLLPDNVLDEFVAVKLEDLEAERELKELNLEQDF